MKARINQNKSGLHYHVYISNNEPQIDIRLVGKLPRCRADKNIDFLFRGDQYRLFKIHSSEYIPIEREIMINIISQLEFKNLAQTQILVTKDQIKKSISSLLESKGFLQKDINEILDNLKFKINEFVTEIKPDERVLAKDKEIIETIKQYYNIFDGFKDEFPFGVYLQLRNCKYTNQPYNELQERIEHFTQQFFSQKNK